MAKLVEPGKTIGIIGGGQLGRMMAFSAKKMGYRVGVLDPTEDCSTAQVADWQIVAEYDNLDALMQLAARSDVVTYEFENVDSEALTAISRQVSVPQGSNLLTITQDRLSEKTYLQGIDLKVAPFIKIEDLQDLKKATEEIGFPCVLKTTRGGYDGKGQIVLKSEVDIEKCADLVSSQVCVLEAWISFDRELSVMVVRNESGEVTVFPVSENIHQNNILHESIIPARIEADTEGKVYDIAHHIAEKVQLVGALGIELFMGKSGVLYVNELAPRPHNSGHYTIEACSISQFDAHIRAVCGHPLPKIELLSPAVMVNILGEHMEKTKAQISERPDWNFHYYGKAEAKKGRKMGHITILTDNQEETLKDLQDAGIWE